ncbi:hypothetical protein AVEN_142225-1 [Araneus ventricosus]|uniref:Uncharacterized protein n=1 Tax=Araneus ventricosus TaxID=182803 RepID=A0A4Y2X3I7_ARAVE|nr:hypothetical protein AVEN_142225-1 [Araneus ventricosus]
MGPCDDLPAKPELLHWGTMRRARRDLVTRLCRASVNSAIKEHGVMCRLTATAFDENDPSVRTLRALLRRKNRIPLPKPYSHRGVQHPFLSPFF